MAITVNGYSVNEVGEPADWSPREHALLSAFAGLMPTSGARFIDNQHFHTIITDSTQTSILSAGPSSIVASISDAEIFNITSGGISANQNLYIKEDIYTNPWQAFDAAVSGVSAFTVSSFYYKSIGDMVFVSYASKGKGNSVATKFRLPIEADTDIHFEFHPTFYEGTAYYSIVSASSGNSGRSALDGGKRKTFEMRFDMS
jgi:hypothetical protein